MHYLRGKIIHRVKLSETCSNVKVDARGKKRNCDSTNKTHENYPSREPRESSGFIFIPTHPIVTTTYLLSLPETLLKMACDAALKKQEIIITRFTKFYLDEDTSNRQKVLLEVHENGLDIKSKVSKKLLLEDNSLESDNVWTLAQFRRLEMADSGTESLDKTKRFNIVATIDSISPIISMDAEKPFAFVELYDKDSECCSCVLVLLSPQDFLYHSALLPGDTIRLDNLIRKSWQCPMKLQKKPFIYQHLNGRIPSSVFLCCSKTRIRWEPGTQITPIPPTTIPLVSLQGKVSRKENLPDTNMLHWVEIMEDVPSKRICRLYLTHFPMSLTLQLGIRTGAIIRAVSVHKLFDRHLIANDLLVFGACLRATVTIIQLASDLPSSRGSNYPLRLSGDDENPLEEYSENSNRMLSDNRMVDSDDQNLSLPHHTQPTFTNEVQESPRLSIKGVIPYRFNKVKVSYVEYVYQEIYRKHIEDWLGDNFQRSLTSSNFLRLPPVDAIIDFVRKEEKERAKIMYDGNSSYSSNSEHCHHRTELMNSDNRQKNPTRNPYAEFFDHGSGELAPNVAHSSFCGCEISRNDDYSNYFGISFVGLHEIRKASLCLFARKFRKLMREQSFSTFGPSGWTGAFHVKCEEILSVMINAKEMSLSSSNVMLYTGGNVSELLSDKKTPASISDKHCQIPVTFSKSSTNIVVKKDFIINRMKKVILSCLCISQPKPETIFYNDEDFPLQESALPSTQTTYFNDNKSPMGGCSLMRVGRYLLVVSIHLIFDGAPTSLQSLGGKKSGITFGNHNKERESTRCMRMESIDNCLRFPKSLNFDYTKGLLIRQRFHHSKLVDGHCQCCVLTLGHITSSNDEFSHLQTIDLKLSIACRDSNLDIFKRKLGTLSDGLHVLQKKITLCTCWWVLADSGRTCALIHGGWDEKFETGKRDLKHTPTMPTGVYLSIPSNAMQITNHGYVRFSCRSNQLLEANYLEIDDCDDVETGIINSNGSCTTESFGFVGSKGFFDGMLSQRPLRRRVYSYNSSHIDRNASRPITGDLLSAPKIPTAITLGTLFEQICRSLQEKDPATLTPSLVQRLRGAHFLGPLFCHVQCICGICFKPLVRYGKPVRQEEETFWHLPAQGTLGGREREAAGRSRLPTHILHSKLHCRDKRHSLGNYQIRWECSGIIDDGTGQAKLYAERDVATTLLGMDIDTLNSIERGLWWTDNGSLTFSKSIPPSVELKKNIQTIVAQSTGTTRDPLQELQPHIRAEYLLQQYCRSSATGMNHPSRRLLDYFVRVKPLSDKVHHLNHTMIDSSFSKEEGPYSSSLGTQDVATYQLPPLKLVVVDLSCPTF